MTKAEEIYTATRKACEKLIEFRGYDGFGLSELSHPYGERICTRTINAVQELLMRDEKKHVLSWTISEKDIQVDSMIRETIYSERKRIEIEDERN